MTSSLLRLGALLAGVAARPEVGDINKHLPHSRRLKMEWPGEPTWQMRAIFSERISPTTDAISFSPRTWPVNWHPWWEPLYKLTVVQRACRMTNNDPNACYTTSGGETPFTFADSDTEMKKYELYRAVGQDTTKSETCNEEMKAASFIGWPKDSDSGPFFATADYNDPDDCRWASNDPRYLKEIDAHVGPGNERYDYTFEVCTRGGTCQSTDYECINAYTVIALADPLATDSRTLFTYTIYMEDPQEGTVARKVDYYPRMMPAEGSGTVDSVYAIPANGPFFPCPTEANGLQIACDDSLAEIPESQSYDSYWSYEDAWSDSYMGTYSYSGGYGGFGRRRLSSSKSADDAPEPADDPAPAGGFARELSEPSPAPDTYDVGIMDELEGPGAVEYAKPNYTATTDLVVFVDKMKIDKGSVMSNEFTTFEVRFKWSAEWTSRFATHPCTINLYDAGEGVGPKGKYVEAATWWTPRPTGELSVSDDVSSNSVLQVLHAPGEPVKKICTLDEAYVEAGLADLCPWPKQLYLKDTLTMISKFKSDWDLTEFPFDKQTLSGTITLVDNIAFSEDKPRVKLNFTSALDEYSPMGNALAGLFPGTAWEPLSASLKQNPRYHLSVDFEIVLKRSAKGPIFKVLLPVGCNALMAILASRTAAASRLKILALSMIVATNMLNPVNLGLPAGVEGLPFVMALVLCHLIIVGLMLITTSVLMGIDHAASEVGDDFRKKKRRTFSKNWKPIFDIKNELDAKVGLPPPPALETPELGSAVAIRSVQLEGTEKKSEEAPSDTPMNLLTKAVLVLPGLIHHATQSTEKFPSHPRGIDKMSFKGDWCTAKERKMLLLNDKVDDFLYALVPPVYLLAWGVMVLIFFPYATVQAITLVVMIVLMVLLLGAALPDLLRPSIN